MKSILAIGVLLLSINVFASTRLIEERQSYRVETINNELPESIKTEMLKKNNKAKSDAVSAAISKIDDKCIDPNWGNISQVDVVDIDTKTLESGGGITVIEVIVNAVCRGMH